MCQSQGRRQGGDRPCRRLGKACAVLIAAGGSTPGKIWQNGSTARASRSRDGGHTSVAEHKNVSFRKHASWTPVCQHGRASSSGSSWKQQRGRRTTSQHRNLGRVRSGGGSEPTSTDSTPSQRRRQWTAGRRWMESICTWSTSNASVCCNLAQPSSKGASNTRCDSPSKHGTQLPSQGMQQ